MKRLQLAAMLLLCSIAAFAQSERGTIQGSVKDSSGAVIIGARVTVTNSDTNSAVNFTSNETGDYAVPSLQAGTYTVRVEKEGFRPALISRLSLNAGTNVRADVTLEVGSTTTAVEVEASALQLSTESAKSTSAVTNKMVDELPLVVSGAMRSPFDLANTTPEAKNLGGDNGFMLGGGQAASYGTNLDGVSANTTRALSQSWVAVNAPSLEAISEFTVDSNGFKAEFGHAGGGLMNFVSKGGTNDYHGTAYEFIRNNAFDANNFFNNRAGLATPVYKQHDFGGSFGGPVWIRYATPVLSVTQSADAVTVVTTRETLTADRVVCTIPCPAIGTIFAQARLSQAKTSAIRDQFYSRTVKVFLQSKTRFWLSQGLSGSATTDLPIERLTPDPGGDPAARGALTAYPIADYTADLERLSESQRVEAALSQAKQIFPELEQQFEGGQSKAWGLDPWQKGSFALHAPNQIGYIRTLGQPEGRLHFAGEHTSHWTGWIQGALESARRVVSEINS